VSGDDSGKIYIWWCVMVNNQLLGGFASKGAICLHFFNLRWMAEILHQLFGLNPEWNDEIIIIPNGGGFPPSLSQGLQ